MKNVSQFVSCMKIRIFLYYSTLKEHCERKKTEKKNVDKTSPKKR